ncbi:MAG TPA: LacI family DNA-binding transcriptional regulator [Acidisoma sp.]|uniref:LacI family DNA-binding transcriptional regulator n=1 Tax=Acidisoma sp. TaxID=1872115 RepID=UPI002C477633|nr:LacI family DNA-binding transcriptional regulator [Acidisoma sp.]HTI02337.1 LacI family DNA-binding transcriptional regulator [Acidisoma sp.]
MRKRYASSVDVAKLAGVSQSAVSRTYKEGGSVSSETRNRVLAAAAELDYRPSVIPRIMLTHRSNFIALVVGGLYNPFYGQVLEKLTTGLELMGHQALLVHADSGHMLDSAIPRLASYRVDAIVSPLAILSPEADKELSRLKIPIVSFNTPAHGDWVSSVCCDNTEAAAAIADLLVRQGGRRFGFVRGPAGSPAAEDRLNGFRQRLHSLGFPRPRVVSGDFTYEGGVRAANKLLGLADRPDAIFCANDLLALGLIDCARRDFGLRVPEDLLVAGFDDIPVSSWPSHSLTTVVQDATAMTQAALDILRRALADSRHRSESVVISGRIIERGSTRRYPAGGAGNVL